MFDAIAGRYDALNHILSLGLDRYWRKRAVLALAPQPDCRILDIGSGTGDMGLEILKQQPGASVTGIDPAEAMLEVAGRKLVQQGLQNSVQFESGDATDLQFDDGSFDGIISAFCIRNVEDRGKAFSEMYRVLRPGGRTVVLELSKPKGRLLRSAHKIYNRVFVPMIGRALSKGRAYRYLVDSIEGFPESGIILEKIKTGGFRETGCIPLTGGIVTIFIGEK